VVFPFLGKGIGGSHISTLILAEELRRRGLDCFFLCPQGTRLQKEVVFRGFPSFDTGEPPADGWSAIDDVLRCPARRNTLAAAIRNRESIVHCNDIAALRSWLPAAKSLAIPVIYHHRSLNRMSVPKRLLLSCADHVICISESTFQNAAFISPERISVILNPFQNSLTTIDRKRSAQELRRELDLESHQRLIGFVGNFWKRKRPDFFIEVASIMLRKVPTLHFAIFGRAGDITREALECQVNALGIAHCVSFLGFRTPPETNLAAVDLILAPAIGEPFGRTLLEAILLGTPYVATRDAGHEEIFERWGGGVAVPRDATVQEFAAISLAALDRRNQLSLCADSCAQISQELSPRKHADKVISVYRRYPKETERKVETERLGVRG